MVKRYASIGSQQPGSDDYFTLPLADNVNQLNQSSNWFRQSRLRHLWQQCIHTLIKTTPVTSANTISLNTNDNHDINYYNMILIIIMIIAILMIIMLITMIVILMVLMIITIIMIVITIINMIIIISLLLRLIHCKSC